MKTSKRILSAILSLCMILGCVAVGFTAQAADVSLQEGINAAIKNGDASYTWNGGNVTLEDTLVINGNIEVDLNNVIVTGAPGKAVVRVNGGNVVLFNGTILAQAPDYSGAVGFAESFVNYDPAVIIKGGNVVLDCITAIGSTLRIPNSHTVEVTTGNGINADAGNVTIRNSIAVGMNAVDNDNKSANVVIEDAILVGIYKAVNNLDRTTFADGYSQYKTIEFIEEFLKDGVTLSATEKKYLNGLTNSEGDLSVASVLVSVKDPAFVEPVSSYDADTDVLTVTAYADVTDEIADVPNRYSYKYAPATCTIDGVTADFAEQSDGTYTATFANVAAGAELAAELDYTLSVKLGKQQKETVLKGLDMIKAYAEKAPEIIGRFIKDFEGDSAYGKVNEYIELAFNAYQTAASDPDLKDSVSALKPIVGVIYALRGENYNGQVTKIITNRRYSEERKIELIKDTAKTQANEYGYNGEAIFDLDGDGTPESLYAIFGEQYGEGLGILELFDEYYEDIKTLALTADYSEFNDIGDAAYYIGKNYGKFIELMDAAIKVLEYGYKVFKDPAIQEFLGGNFGDLQVIMDYADRIFDGDGLYYTLIAKYEELKASDFVAKYGDRAPELCRQYALKALDIVQNPTKYFEINSKVEGDYLNMFSYKQTATFETPADVETCNVTVKVSGFGKFMVDGKTYTTDKTFAGPMGELFTVTPVEYDDSDPLFREFFYTQLNAEWKVVENMDNFRVGSDIIITLYYSDKENTSDEDVNVFFLTDKNLSYNRIGSYYGLIDDLYSDEDVIRDGEGAAVVSAPEFKGLEFAGWSLDKDSSAEDALTYDELIIEISGKVEDFFVYAIYENKQELDGPSGHEELAVINASADPETSRVYFLMSVEAPENIKVIEAGVIATKNADFATDAKMTLALRGTSGVASKFADGEDVKGNGGYLINSFYYNYGVKTGSGTVYGRGYVIYENLDTKTVETYYTDIVSDTL